MSWTAIRHELATELGESISIDALTGAWRIAQRDAGHRHSADDVLTAWFALREMPHAPIALDLGTGIGGVGLLVLWGLGEAARLVAIEAQAISFRLLQANVAGNELTARVDAIHGDLRELADARRFPLVTGSPPYFPLGTGIVPADSQKAHARFELRGDVADYARAAARHVTDDGVFVFCFPTPQKERALAAVRDAGLVATRVQDVVPRATLRPLFTLFAARRAGDVVEEAPFVVREQSGELTAAMQQVRRGFGFY
ncbi:MAG: methyltransferase [Deltaproteobacteria bacterium]|nr:methyltransferase [Deltaproteobacteria bacterium]